ncbi:hypothetical protein K2173_025813 [Erythroxylum novogranatense]|uniref:Uncharacterized protein n=1 Tax=Erythroxylum novogranatense TaxID=1862640 RepID=A0AAV8SI26_9ROSI|nr:hypothetical protein K2173_025813 [Erythroxylum novogranatense]
MVEPKSRKKQEGFDPSPDASPCKPVDTIMMKREHSPCDFSKKENIHLVKPEAECLWFGFLLVEMAHMFHFT